MTQTNDTVTADDVNNDPAAEGQEQGPVAAPEAPNAEPSEESVKHAAEVAAKDQEAKVNSVNEAVVRDADPEVGGESFNYGGPVASE